MTMVSRFQTKLKQNKLISESDRILVAFSGGKDSVCLLILLHKLRDLLKIDLAACHVHHGIRGIEADEDLTFCRNLCSSLSVDFFEEKVDAPRFCNENKLGLEEGARILRYEVLNKIASANGYNKIATAHTASDQAETILFHLIRGSGLAGMSGIHVQRERIIRPLLDFHKDEIVEFLNDHHISFKEDSSNRDILFSRNRLRKNVLPEMALINPSVEKSLVRFGRISKEQNDLLDHLCDRWESEHNVLCRNGCLPLEAFHDLIDNQALTPILRTILSRMAEKEKIVIDFQHFSSLQALLKQPVEGKIIEISKGYGFKIENGFLVFAKNESAEECINYQVSLFLGDNPLPIPSTLLSVSDKRCGKVENFNKKRLIIHAAFDKIKGDLFARNRREGDCIQIDGMTKSVKKLMQEAKVPVRYRNLIPLVCDQEGILWIPYVGLCDRVRHSATDNIFTLSLISEKFSET